jgi:hypothetical protein
LSKVRIGVSPRFEVFVEEIKKSGQWSVEFKEQVAQA